ncbi:MIP transporter [Penicillium waksmanii]|uniref:MIP transporter n=1 Tax=Penicillium waksmanii TaxID=69791 RepID=UPI002548BFD3|nr:MIP transporter [Penicillium waksmanii]KAJ5984644.1 MIP transporter [Penicillium waksmanii]
MSPSFAPEQNGTCSMNVDDNIERSGLKPTIRPFAGRIGGNQGLVLDPSDASNAELLKRMPDAAPLMSLKQSFNLTAFSDIDLWRFGAVECKKSSLIQNLGTMMLVFMTSWLSAHSPIPTTTLPASSDSGGIYSTATFLGPLVGGITNWLFLTLFIFSFSSVSGAHLNPLITMATFFARLISIPRMVLYLAGQIIGGTLAGLMLRTSFGSRNFVVGGCDIDTSLVPTGEAFVLEFICCLTLLFLSFGVGLDPRQSKVYGTALSPWLVGLSLGVVSWASAFTRLGYGGASLNPARCFGVYVGSHFPGYHWIHWVGPIAASIGHGLMYYLVPPWAVVTNE